MDQLCNRYFHAQYTGAALDHNRNSTAEILEDETQERLHVCDCKM